jgi:hypothetical protein
MAPPPSCRACLCLTRMPWPMDLLTETRGRSRPHISHPTVKTGRGVDGGRYFYYRPTPVVASTPPPLALRCSPERHHVAEASPARWLLAPCAATRLSIPSRCRQGLLPSTACPSQERPPAARRGSPERLCARLRPGRSSHATATLGSWASPRPRPRPRPPPPRDRGARRKNHCDSHDSRHCGMHSRMNCSGANAPRVLGSGGHVHELHLRAF